MYFKIENNEIVDTSYKPVDDGGTWILTNFDDFHPVIYRDGEVIQDMDNALPQPTAEEVANVGKMLLRRQRDRLLSDTDWIITRASDQGVSTPTEWATYRQALRDITDTYTSLEDVIWPTKPE
jgi:hypothetical protein